MSNNIKTETYIENQTNHYHYHNTEAPEPHTEVLLESHDDDTDSIVEAEIKPVTARTFSQRVRSLEPVKKRLLLALKGSSKAYMNQGELRDQIHVDTEDMTNCLRSNPKLFGMRKESLAFIWYLTKQGKRLKKKSLSANKGTSSNSTQAKDS